MFLVKLTYNYSYVFSDPVTSFLTFLHFSQKCARVYRPVRSFCSFMKFCLAQTFWVERHLDVVLDVLQVVGSKFLFFKTCRELPLEDSLKKLR